MAGFYFLSTKFQYMANTTLTNINNIKTTKQVVLQFVRFSKTFLLKIYLVEGGFSWISIWKIKATGQDKKLLFVCEDKTSRFVDTHKNSQTQRKWKSRQRGRRTKIPFRQKKMASC